LPMKVNACFAAFETLHFEITHLALTRSARLRAGFSVRQHEGTDFAMYQKRRCRSSGL